MTTRHFRAHDQRRAAKRGEFRISRKSIDFGLVWLCAGLAHAQSTTSTILGHVRPETQAALPGAEVTARHVESGLVRSTTADDTGHFTLAALPVGTYDLTAQSN